MFNESRELDFVPAALRRELGAIEVFHFQNLEGLTRSFFVELRRVDRCLNGPRPRYSRHGVALVGAESKQKGDRCGSQGNPVPSAAVSDGAVCLLPRGN